MTRGALARWLVVLAAVLAALAPLAAGLHQDHDGPGCAVCQAAAQPVLEARRAPAVPASRESGSAPALETTRRWTTPLLTGGPSRAPPA